MMLLVGMILGVCLAIFAIFVLGVVCVVRYIFKMVKVGKTKKITNQQNQLNEVLKMGVLEELQKGNISINEFNESIRDL